MPVRLRLTVLLAALLPLAAIAQSAPASTAVTATDAAPNRPLLWKVSDADNAIYLLGSFHLLQPGDYPLPAEVDRAFADAEALVFEVEPGAMTSPEAVASMQKYMAIDGGKTLSQVVPKATLDKLGAAMGAGGGALPALEGSEPWAVNLGLVLGMTQAMGFRPDLGLDKHLMDRAAKAGKPATGLETIDDQFRALDAVPHAEQVAGLAEFLDDPAKAATQMRDLHAWWRSGNVESLDREMRTEMASKTPHSYRLLNVARNQAWLPQLRQRLDGVSSGETLVVVGALHLLGPDGLVEQLRAKGYRVERLCDLCTAAND
jgi:uncharacterized protein YbaP (TraB family)